MRLKLLKKFFLVICLALSLGKMSPIYAQASVGDTIQLYGFEDGVDSLGIPTGCVLGEHDYNKNGEFILDETVFHTGSASGLIQGVDEELISMDPYLPNIDLVEKGGKYSFSVWLKTEMTEGAFAVQITPQWDYYEYPAANTEWTEYTGTFEAAANGESAVTIGLYGKGKIWIDDVTIIKLKDPVLVPTDRVANPGFEEPNDDGTAPINWRVENWGSGSTEIGLPGDNTRRYIWDNTESYSGEYSAKIQVTQDDLTYGSMDAAWSTTNMEYVSGGVYEMKYMAKTKNFKQGAKGNYLRLNFGYNNANQREIRGIDTDWIEVCDTIIFPTDQDDHAARNHLRFRLSGPVDADTMAQAWIDDVVFTLIGNQASQLESLTAVRSSENSSSVNLQWTASPDVANPIYHVTIQPYNEKGIYEANLLTNPGFEEPNDDGSAPKDWTFSNTHYSAAVSEFPAAETYDGDFSVYVTELDPSNPVGIEGRWVQTYKATNMQPEQAFLYGAMVKFINVIPSVDSVISDIHPNGWYNNCGVNIYYDRYHWDFQNADLVKMGYTNLTGTSDGWVQISLPIICDQAISNHRIGIGIGADWGGSAKGEIYIDNAFVVPFEESVTTSSTSITLENVPNGAKYFAVYVEDANGEKIPSTSRIAMISSATTDVDNEDILPTAFELKQNYPNPFNPSTTIEYSVPEAGIVKLSIYNILGQKVVDLVNDNFQSAGVHKVEFNASKYTSGVYFYKISTPGHEMTKKMMLIK